jgi:multidrug transporter EmrE-like cation transporter
VIAIAWFEFATKLRRISTYVYFAVFTAIAALWVAAAGGSFCRRMMQITIRLCLLSLVTVRIHLCKTPSCSLSDYFRRPA